MMLNKEDQKQIEEMIKAQIKELLPEWQKPIPDIQLHERMAKVETEIINLKEITKEGFYKIDEKMSKNTNLMYILFGVATGIITLLMTIFKFIH